MNISNQIIELKRKQYLLELYEALLDFSNEFHYIEALSFRLWDIVILDTYHLKKEAIGKQEYFLPRLKFEHSIEATASLKKITKKLTKLVDINKLPFKRVTHVYTSMDEESIDEYFVIFLEPDKFQKEIEDIL